MLLADNDEVDYGHFPDEGRLAAAMGRVLALAPKEMLQLGDVLLLRVDGRAQHLGIVADYAGGDFSLIHAYAPARAVVEHRLDEVWRAKIVKVFRWHSSS